MIGGLKAEQRFHSWRPMSVAGAWVGGRLYLLPSAIDPMTSEAVNRALAE